MKCYLMMIKRRIMISFRRLIPTEINKIHTDIAHSSSSDLENSNSLRDIVHTKVKKPIINSLRVTKRPIFKLKGRSGKNSFISTSRPKLRRSSPKRPGLPKTKSTKKCSFYLAIRTISPLGMYQAHLDFKTR